MLHCTAFLCFYISRLYYLLDLKFGPNSWGLLLGLLFSGLQMAVQLVNNILWIYTHVNLIFVLSVFPSIDYILIIQMPYI